MSETIKVLCYKSKTLSNGEHPLMLCVCKDRKRKFQSLGISIKAELWDFKTNQPKGCMVDISIKRSCPVNLWNQAKENSKGKDRISVELNHYLEIIRSHVHQIYRELETSGKVITVDLVKKLFYGVDEDNKTLLQVFREHNEQSRKLIGKDFVSKTVQRYETTTRYLEEFIKKEYQLPDIALNNLEANFISKFDAFS